MANLLPRGEDDNMDVLAMYENQKLAEGDVMDKHQPTDRELRAAAFIGKIAELDPKSDFASELAYQAETLGLLDVDEKIIKRRLDQMVKQASGHYSAQSAQFAAQALLDALNETDNEVEQAHATNALGSVEGWPDAELAQQLYAPFPSEDEYKDPRGYTYIKENPIIRRLNECFGPFNYDVDFADGSQGRIVCIITVYDIVDGKRVVKCKRSGGSAMMKDDDPGQYRKDGTPSKTNEDTAKTAYTDAFKRAARMLGIGQYLLTD